MAVRKTASFYRLLSASSTRKTTRKSWRVRTKRAYIKLTSEQKAKKRKQRFLVKQSYQQSILDAHQQLYALAAEIHEKFPNRRVKSIAADIFQSDRLKVALKDVGPYHAFLMAEAKRINDEAEAEGKGRRKINQLSGKISEMWKAMSAEERIEATKTDLESLRERRLNKEVGTHNVDIASSQDSTITAEKLRAALERLGVRTGDEGTVIVTRGDSSRFHRPFVWATSPRVHSFFETVFNSTLEHVGLKMDSYMVLGIEGVAKTQQQQLQELKASTGKLIRTKLEEVLKSPGAKTVHYAHFDRLITKQHGVVIRNWPLKTFVNPSRVSTKAELDLLWSSWNSGTTHFYRMSRSELETWEAEYKKVAAGEGLGVEVGDGGVDKAIEQTNEQVQSPGDNSLDTNQVQHSGNTSLDKDQLGASAASVGGGQESSSSSVPGSSNSAGINNGATTFVHAQITTDATGAAKATRTRKPRSDRGKPRKKRAIRVAEQA
ncbi:hypothetical protein F5878DRAFT_655693 [Lentinula raphanica]|uniref:Uncharacterized protein n=1 Tax=Lentinula raphanica TaxID=153919 RepID=A0AA38PKL0_9AGAR|nr:hypothetical protein F5878DRAFT_655693 [Lentinula raphanica]